jgi:hypothetical protein
MPGLFPPFSADLPGVCHLEHPYAVYDPWQILTPVRAAIPLHGSLPFYSVFAGR